MKDPLLEFSLIYATSIPLGANKGSAQDQYAMWAAYYAQYAQYAQPQAAVNGAQIPGQEQAQQNMNGGQYDENVYKQWIEYYKAYGMTNEAEQMEKSLRDYKNSKKVGFGVFFFIYLLIFTYLYL